MFMRVISVLIALKLDSVHYADENVYLIDCLDYVQYSIRVEGLKAS